MSRPIVSQYKTLPNIRHSLIRRIKPIFIIDNVRYSNKAYKNKLYNAAFRVINNSKCKLTDAITLTIIRDAINDNFTNNLLSNEHKTKLMTLLADISTMKDIFDSIYARYEDSDWRCEMTMYDTVGYTNEANNTVETSNMSDNKEASYILPSQYTTILNRLDALNEQIAKMQTEYVAIQSDITNINVLSQ